MLNKTKQEFHPDLEGVSQSARNSAFNWRQSNARRRWNSGSRRNCVATRTLNDLYLRLDVHIALTLCNWSTQRSSLMSRDNIEAGEKLEAAADLSSVNAYEDDFM
ncbi:unnamed protein product [Phytophthora fragariaefolia]|uniref:Unnamed protein product n=1 Tax=Phytophthora fragariaefolia TaxID=1490495 RepID=A0A9W6WUM7_9STRA|nr:unnamed protein product [Phytophthora fragariaefolia]